MALEDFNLNLNQKARLAAIVQTQVPGVELMNSAKNRPATFIPMPKTEVDPNLVNNLITEIQREIESTGINTFKTFNLAQSMGKNVAIHDAKSFQTYINGFLLAIFEHLKYIISVSEINIDEKTRLADEMSAVSNATTALIKCLPLSKIKLDNTSALILLLGYLKGVLEVNYGKNTIGR